METQKETIIITGSSGLIGSAAVERLASSYRIAGFDRPGAPHPPPVAEAISVDLSSDEFIDYAFERLETGYGRKIASVIHLAAYYNFAGGSSRLYDEITVKGTERLLNRLQRFEVGQFIFSSTMLVHAPCKPGEKINEDWPLEPKWDYPKSKVTTEQLIQQKRGSMPTVNLRIAGIYTNTGHSIPLTNQMQRIYERQLTSHFYPGDLQCGQTFMHLDDMIDVLELTVKKRSELPPELTLVIGEPETLGYGELQQTFASLIHNEEWNTYRIPKTLAKIGAWVQDLLPGRESFIKPWMIDLADDHYTLDISRARSILGWEPRHNLRETLPKMVQALKENPVRWYRDNNLEIPSALSV